MLSVSWVFLVLFSPFIFHLSFLCASARSSLFNASIPCLTNDVYSTSYTTDGRGGVGAWECGGVGRPT